MKMITISYYLITLLVLLTLLTNVGFTTGLVLWITYIGMMLLNIDHEVRKNKYENELEKLRTEIKRFSKKDKA